MRHLVHVFICMVLVVWQTVLVPFCLPALYGFDFLLLFVIYAGLHLTTGEAVSKVVLLSLVMDGVSAAPFGVYLITYMALCLMIRWMIHFFRPDNPLLIAGIAWGGIVIENGMAGISIFLMSGHGIWSGMGIRQLFQECLVGLMIGPFAVLLMRRVDVLAGRVSERWRFL